MDMPPVKMCSAENCAFNTGKACHALGITVGDPNAASCDTFMESGTHVKHATEMAGVGACKMEDCRHNEGLYCTADSIEVRKTANGAVCATYEPAKERVRT